MNERLIVIVLLVLVIVLPLGYVLLDRFRVRDGEEEVVQTESFESETSLIEETASIKNESNIKIFNGNDRPIAFMIDNNVNAQPQASINSAYVVYEIIVEGGESRLMAIFKGVNTDSVGPIRSARHYFLDYALENDAIYAHLGTSPQADSDMIDFNMDHINGQFYDSGKARTDSSLYWRASHKKAPHNAYTSIDSILKIAGDRHYSTTSSKKSVLKYSENEVELDMDGSKEAKTVTIPYATNHKVQYKYNEETKRYTRYSKGRKITDELTKEETTVKNIIITFAKNYTLDDGENKGRQDVVTVGELDGYYITNGKAIKIKCCKTDRKEQTVYKDLNGNEINVNDGNTWINVCPIDAKVTIE